MSWTINSKTAKTAWTDTDNLVIQESGNTVKKLALSVLRKIIPATDSTTAFQVMKADGTTQVFGVQTSGTPSINVPANINHNITTGSASWQTNNSAANGPTMAMFGISHATLPGQIYVTSDTSNATAGSGNVYFRQYNGSSYANTFIVEKTGAVKFPAISTTASAANAYLDSGTSNSLLRSTSSAKYKTDIKDLADSSVLDDLRPIVYKSNPETVPNDDPTKEHYGFIAEELDEVDSKLVHYIKDEDGKEIPDGVQYERVVVLLVKRIHELEERLTKAGI